MRKMIYLSGAIEGLEFSEHNDWRKELHEKFKNSGHDVVVFNPNNHFTEKDLFDWHITPETIMKYDLLKLRESDVVIVNFTHPKSLGTMAELAIAYERRIPIIGFVRPPHAWQKAMCDVIFEDMEEAFVYVCKHYLGEVS